MRIGSTLYYVLKDHLGSASVITNASGVTISGGEQRYYPYGESRLTATMLTDKLFTGQREMAGLGIYYYQARFYSPRLGRFLSPDTIVPSYTNSQSLNRFSYVLNNPLRYTDPTGHMVSEDDGGGTLENTLTYFKKYGKHKDRFNNYYRAVHAAEMALADSVHDGLTQQELQMILASEGGAESEHIQALNSVPQAEFSNSMLVPRSSLAFRGAQMGFALLPEITHPKENQEVIIGFGASGATVAYRFVKGANGTLVPIPADWIGTVANNGQGMVYQQPGAAGNANSIRIMDPNAQYPNGYVRYYNSAGQPLTVNGNPGPNPETHIPLDYQGPLPGWPKK